MLDKNGYISGGSITYDGEDMAKYTAEQEWLKVRGKKIAMVFQDPMLTLNPTIPVGKQITEAIIKNQKVSRDEAKKRAVEMLKLVGIPDAEQRYGLQTQVFSG